MATTQGRRIWLKPAICIACGPVVVRHAAERLASISQISQWRTIIGKIAQWLTAIGQVAQGLIVVRLVAWKEATPRLSTGCWPTKAGIAGCGRKTAVSFLGSRYPWSNWGAGWRAASAPVAAGLMAVVTGCVAAQAASRRTRGLSTPHLSGAKANGRGDRNVARVPRRRRAADFWTVIIGHDSNRKTARPQLNCREQVGEVHLLAAMLLYIPWVLGVGSVYCPSSWHLFRMLFSCLLSSPPTNS